VNHPWRLPATLTGNSRGAGDPQTVGFSVADPGAEFGPKKGPKRRRTRARELKYGVTLNGWERLLASLEANAQDFPQLETYRAQLKALLEAARETSAQQTAMAATKQEATKRLQGALVDGRKLANFLRNGVRQHYGNRAEKLVEFDLKPLRNRVKTTAQPPTVKPPTTPPPTPTPGHS
jgi:hypothetical protein